MRKDRNLEETELVIKIFFSVTGTLIQIYISTNLLFFFHFKKHVMFVRTVVWPMVIWGGLSIFWRKEIRHYQLIHTLK